jgi:hypothetical protein
VRDENLSALRPVMMAATIPTPVIGATVVLIGAAIIPSPIHGCVRPASK